jgi:hypothetical protein
MDFLAKLSEITQKEIAALTEADIIFLKARRSYLTPEQLETYAPVLEPKKKVKK